MVIKLVSCDFCFGVTIRNVLRDFCSVIVFYLFCYFTWMCCVVCCFFSITNVFLEGFFWKVEKSWDRSSFCVICVRSGRSRGGGGFGRVWWGFVVLDGGRDSGFLRGFWVGSSFWLYFRELFFLVLNVEVCWVAFFVFIRFMFSGVAEVFKFF